MRSFIMPYSATNIGLLKRISCMFTDIAAKKKNTAAAYHHNHTDLTKTSSLKLKRKRTWPSELIV